MTGLRGWKVPAQTDDDEEEGDEEEEEGEVQA